MWRGQALALGRVLLRVQEKTAGLPKIVTFPNVAMAIAKGVKTAAIVRQIAGPAHRGAVMANVAEVKTALIVPLIAGPVSVEMENAKRMKPASRVLQTAELVRFAGTVNATGMILAAAVPVTAGLVRQFAGMVNAMGARPAAAVLKTVGPVRRSVPIIYAMGQKPAVPVPQTVEAVRLVGEAARGAKGRVLMVYVTERKPARIASKIAGPVRARIHDVRNYYFVL